MTAELTQLLEEAATVSQDLAEDASKAVETIKTVLSHASDLADRLQEEGGEARQQFRALSAKLGEAETKLAGSAESARSALDGVESQAGSLRGEISGVLERIREALQEVGVKSQEVAGKVDLGLQEAQTEVNERLDQLRGVSEGMNEQATHAGEGITALRSAVADARADLEEKREAWGAALDHLQGAVAEESDRWVQGLRQLLMTQTRALIEVSNQMLTAHNEAMTALKSGLTEGVSGELSAAVEELSQKLTSLGETAAPRVDHLDARSLELLGRLRQAMPRISEIQEVLETTQDLG